MDYAVFEPSSMKGWTGAPERPETRQNWLSNGQKSRLANGRRSIASAVTINQRIGSALVSLRAPEYASKIKRLGRV
jgi:hypothetical protein